MANSFEWHSAEPQAQGMSGQKLEALRAELSGRGTTGLLVVRHDKIVLEWYGPGFGPDKQHGTASLAKALVGGMSLAIAMQDGRIRPEDLAARYVPQWKDDPQKSKITIGQLAMHSSGLDDAEENHLAHDKLTGWKGDFWKRTPDPFTLARDKAPVVFPPGQRVRYSNPGMAMLAYAVTASIRAGSQKDIRSLLRDRIYRPIGIGDKEWTIGYGQTYHVDGLELVADWGGGSFTPRAVARIGRLMLRQGDWDGQRILDPSIVHDCVAYDKAPPANGWEGDESPQPGFGWWTNRQGACKSVPRDTYIGAGAGHQLLVVIPSLDLIVVRNGSTLSSEPNWVAIDKYLLAPAVAAVTDPPYRPSSVIRAIHFDPPESIIRKALDSDNWPITWGDDDNLYTAYGDGEGFEPFIERKLSLGLARVQGIPPKFEGFNIRSPSAERTGDGAKGPKASGMLMVDSVLYMFVRNTHNSTLAWSTDHGKNWTWGFSFDTSLGCPAFLNFGRNYAGARDEYVYIYSQDGPGAYEPYDGIVLARVAKDRVRDRASYEFFAGTDTSGQARWNSDISRRAHVFHYDGNCERLDVVYDVGINRYLLALSFGHGQGWGIFDASQPWGPWTTAFITGDWGLGQTHGYRLPSKWISEDGTVLWLVFSGRPFGKMMNDAFCVRRMTIDLHR